MEDSNVLWRKDETPKLPKRISNITEYVDCGIQLSTKDQKQIVKTFNDESYEMVSTYIWTKAMNSLKTQLATMGISFIGEMLDRPDLNEYTSLQQAITDFEAVRLAEELAVISGTAAMRLRQAMELVGHFNKAEIEDELSEDETKTIIRSCIEGVLGYNMIEAALDFKNFRTKLEEETFTDDNPIIIKLVHSPYFFHRTTIRIILSIIKSSSGAQLENVLANANLIIPKIWETLKHPERYQIGRSYSELFTDGKTKAASGLKQVLLKVKGFDFVPENLRSSSFIKIANEILLAHEGFDNFYNEPAPVNSLLKMGSIIPAPAFPICMTAVLCVRLGNTYGVSRGAKENAIAILKLVPMHRWIYFFNECIQTDERVLYKLTYSEMSNRWIAIFSEDTLDQIMDGVNDSIILKLLKAMRERRTDKVIKIARELYTKIGYSNG